MFVNSHSHILSKGILIFLIGRHLIFSPCKTYKYTQTFSIALNDAIPFQMLMTVFSMGRRIEENFYYPRWFEKNVLNQEFNG